MDKKKSNNVKYTYDYVKQYFENKGCVLLSSEYINCGSKLSYVCKCGKETSISFGKFMSQKKGCKYCTKIGGYSNEEVKQYFLDCDCELLEDYKGIKEKIKYKCSCGEISFITFDNFKRGKRCVKCGLNKLSETFRTDIEYVKKYFIENNCIPLFEKYINDRQKLKYQCECTNITYIRFIDFKNGRRCNKCAGERRAITNYQNGNIATSSQQIFIHSLTGGILNYPEGSACLDIAFPEEMIMIEYDGSGHDLGVKLNSISREEFDKKEVRRRYALYRRGWKEIRIVSKQDLLPNSENIIKMINFGKNILKERSWVVFDIDHKELKYRDKIEKYNFGELKRFRRD